MADTTETTAHPTGDMSYTQTPAVCEKKHFSLILFHSASENKLFLQDEETEALLSADFEIGHFFRERVIPKVLKYLIFILFTLCISKSSFQFGFN